VPTEKIVEEFLSDYEADIVVLLNPSCPFIQVSTINKCIKNIENSKFDSAFSALEFQKYAWSKREPLNFNKDRYSAKLKSLDKINIEQGMMYVLKKDSFLNRTRRIGGNPYIQNINFFEGLEVSSDKDFEVAELIINSGMFHGVGHE
jgi:CMP-N-acetylneuraminic acid synthetase